MRVIQGEKVQGTIWVGIDCGKAGAVAVVVNPETVYAFHVPTVVTRKKRPRKKTASGKPSVSTTVEYDLPAMCQLIRNIADLYSEHTVKIAIERQQGMPRDSKRTVFAVGRGQGLWEMAATAAGIEPVLIKPAVWKLCYVEEKADKEASVAICKQILPGLTLKLRKDEALAEAALIADYIRRADLNLSYPRGM